MTPRLTTKKIESISTKSIKLGEKLEAFILELRTLSSGDYRAADESRVRKLREARALYTEAFGYIAQGEEILESIK